MNASDRRALTEQVAELQEAYAQCIDSGEIESWPAFFTEKGVYRIVPRENHDLKLPIAIMFCDGQGMLKDRVFSLREANIYAKHFYRHLVGRPRLAEEHADGSFGFETNYAVFRTLEQGETRVFSAGRYVDRVVFEGDTARFAEKLVIYDNTWVDTLLVTPL